MAQISTTKCGACSENDGSFFCYDCKQALCKACQNFHNRFEALKSHTVTEIGKVDRLVYKAENQCGDHKEPFISFCTACKCLICHVCLSTIHKGHEFSGIEGASKEARQDLDQSIIKGKSTLTQLEKIITDIESGLLVKLEEERKEKAEKIKTTTKVVEGLLDIVSETKINDTDAFIHVEKDKLKMTLRATEALHKEYTTAIRTFEQLQEIAHDTTYLGLYFRNKDDLLKLDDIPTYDQPETLDEFQVIEFFREVVEKMNGRYECDVLEKEKKQIDDLKAEVKELKDEMQRTKEQHRDVLEKERKQIENLKTEVKRVNDEMQSDVLEKERKQIDNLKAEVKEVNGRIQRNNKEHQDVLEKERKQIDDLKAEVNKLKNEMQRQEQSGKYLYKCLRCGTEQRSDKEPKSHYGRQR